MESKAKLFGHAIHPMLIVFPLGLLVSAVIFDIIYLVTDNTIFSVISFYNISAGIIGGLLAALFGWVDWFAIPNDTRAKSVGLYHGLGNVLLLVLFAGSWFLRFNSPDYVPSTLALALSFGGILLGTITAWLGGELVERLGIGVDAGANLNAPSSLSGEPAMHGVSRQGVMIPQTGEPFADEQPTPDHDRDE